MEKGQASIQEQKELYSTAIEFKKIECWNWMYDSDLFGVQNPANGEIGYCCIMGNLGEVFALAVYLGTEGLEGYFKMQSGKHPSEDIDLIHSQKCLIASFEDREFLQKEDLEITKKLNLKFRGQNAWPLFRNYQPGYHPWYLTSDEARYLPLALQQAVDVCLRFEKDEDLLHFPKMTHFLVRVSEKDGGTLIWKDKWLKPEPLEKVEFVPEPADEVRLQRIKREAAREQQTWEIDFFYSSVPVREKEERPCYPYTILFVDNYSGFILNSHMTPHSNYEIELSEKFLDLMENTQILPKEVYVKKKEVFKIIEQITTILGIKLRLVKKLEMSKQAQYAMFEHFGK